MRILLHAADRAAGAAIARAVPAGARLLLADDVGALLRGAAGADVVLVELPTHAAPTDVSMLAALRQRFGGMLLVVVPRSADVVRDLWRCGADALLWQSDVARELPAALRLAAGRTPLAALRADAQRATHIPVQLRRALLRLTDPVEPCRFVGELTRAVGCHRATLRRQWRAHAAPGTTTSLEECVGWLLLVHAHARKPRARSWEAVAHELAISPQRLARLARRLGFRTLGTLGQLDAEALTATVRAWLGPVLAPPPDGAAPQRPSAIRETMQPNAP